MNDDNIKNVPIKDLRQEEGASELASSPDMAPYLEVIIAEMKGEDLQPHLDALSKLPLEKRYVWRVASALKWGFADFDTEPIQADRQTISPGDLAKVLELLRLRPMQFCMFLSALVGPEEMKKMMVQAIRVALQQA